MKAEWKRYKTAVWNGSSFTTRDAVAQAAPSSTIVRVLQTGFCGTDHHALSQPQNVGVSMGHEILGEIVQLGPNVRSVAAQPLAVGDRVVVIPGVPCGTCENCLSYSDQAHLCDHRSAHGWGRYSTEGFFPAGGFSTYIELIDNLWVYKVPEHYSIDIGTLAEPLAIAVRAVDRALAGARPDRDLGSAVAMRAVVVGMGAIGCLISYILRTIGADVVGVETNGWKAEQASSILSIPVVHTPSAEAPEANAHVRAQLPHPEFDVAFECAGEPEALHTAILLVRKGGKVVELGNATRGAEVTIDPALVCRKELDLVGMVLAPPFTYSKVFRILERFDHQILERLISHRFTLANINDLLPVLESGEYLKIAVHP